MKKEMGATIILMGFAASAVAEIELPNILSDNMVLQRGAQVAVWGWAPPGETVTVEFAGQKTAATAVAKDVPPQPGEGAFLLDGRRKRWLLRDSYPRSEDGKPMARWLVHLDPMPASAEGRTLTVRSQASDRKIEIHNVLVGEVWFAAGQSNMSWGIKQRIKNKEEALALADNPLIRLTKPRYGGCQERRFGTPFTWDVCSPRTTRTIISAAAGSLSWRKGVCRHDAGVAGGDKWMSRLGNEDHAMENVLRQVRLGCPALNASHFSLQ